MKLNVTLTPMGAYFLGTERNASYDGEKNSQQSELNPYFIRSGKYPAQSALLGILRYVGIQNPSADFSIRRDADNIGQESYDLLSAAPQSFGKIHSVSNLMLTDRDARHYIPAPRNHLPIEDKDWEENKDHVESAEFCPFTKFSAVNTIDNVRYYPTEYDEKKAWDDAELLCLEDGRLYNSPFESRVQVGINRQPQTLDKKDRTVNGFFKKEYTVLKKGFSFFFTAEVEDDFRYHPQTVAYVGQGQSPFAVSIEKNENAIIGIPAQCVPASVTVNGKGQRVCYAVAMSDCYYPHDISDLKEKCSFMMADTRSYRVFTTNYTTGDPRSTRNRYKKHDEALRLLKAGSVFLFFGTDEQTPEAQAAAFVNELKLAQPVIAGFNQLHTTI